MFYFRDFVAVFVILLPNFVILLPNFVFLLQNFCDFDAISALTMIIWHTSNLFYVLLTLKWIQKWILDPLLDLFFGYKTRFGWRKERRERVFASSPDTVKVRTNLGSYKNVLITNSLKLYVARQLSCDQVLSSMTLLF